MRIPIYILLFSLLNFSYGNSFCQAQDTTKTFIPITTTGGIIEPSILFSHYNTMPSATATLKERIESIGGTIYYDSTNSFYKEYFLDSAGTCYKKGSKIPFNGEIKNDALKGNDTISFVYKNGIIVEKKVYYRNGKIAELWKEMPYEVLIMNDSTGASTYVYYQWSMVANLPYKLWYENGQLRMIITEKRWQEWYENGKPFMDTQWEGDYQVFRRWDETGKLVTYSKTKIGNHIDN